MNPREIPLLIAFAPGASLLREQPRPSQLPIVGNGPAGTFILLPHLRLRVSLPTDQIVFLEPDAEGNAAGKERDDGGNAARDEDGVIVGFGGMAFRGEECGELVFDRVRELHPEDQLSPDRSHVMRLDPAWVRSITSEGHRLWPPDSAS